MPRLVSRRRWAWSAALFALVLPVALGSANGGYFSGSWDWATLACAWAAALALLLDGPLSLPWAGVAQLGLFAVLAGWTLLSALWSADVPQSVLEAERTLVYLAGALAALLLGGRSRSSLLTGTWAAITLLAGYGLLTRLFPERLGVVDPISGYRLSQPIGYWNSLGLLAAMGALLGVGLAARSPRRLCAAAAAASLVPLFGTLYFTFSRGAWIAFAFGLAALLLVERARLRLLGLLLSLAPWVALSVWLASTKTALTHAASPLAAMSHDGHRLALTLVPLACVAAVSALAARAAAARVAVPKAGRRALAATLAFAFVVGVVVVSLRFGSPLALAGRGWRAFASPPPASGGNLNARLFTASGSGRVTQWKVAWREFEANPWLGGGAGSFERYWDRQRPLAVKVRDVHNLYLETLAELGPLGLALLVGALAVPLAGLRRARAEPLAAAAAGAYAAYLLHVTVDWDWEITAVTLPALLCAATLLLAGGRGERPPRTRPRRGRAAALAAVALVAAAAVYGIAERVTIAKASAAASAGRWAQAERDAGRAAALAPWSSEAWQKVGEAELAASRFARARRSIGKALARDRGGWALWLDLARASEGRARAVALEQAGRLNPRSPEIAAFRQTLRSLARIEAHP